MAQTGMHASLQIEEDMAFQHRTWRVERIGWAVMALLVIAALLGLFAVGPLSSTATRDPAGLLTIAYGRFQRQSAPMTIKVDVAPVAAKGGTIELQVGPEFIDALRIERIQPTPAETTLTSMGQRFRFKAAPGAPTAIYFYLQPQAIGAARLKLGLPGQRPAELDVFTYP